MCGAQQFQCMSESVPQMIGAHQPQQACNEYTHVHCCESTVTTGWKRGHISWDSWGSLSELRSLGTGALFLISESGHGEGAQLLASRPDYMEFAMQATTEWNRGHIWDILATVQPWAWGWVPPPLVSEVVWKGTAVFYPPWPDYRGFKIPSFGSRGHSSICAPLPHLFFQQYMERFFFVFLASSGGGDVPLSPPPRVRHCKPI